MHNCLTYSICRSAVSEKSAFISKTMQCAVDPFHLPFITKIAEKFSKYTYYQPEVISGRVRHWYLCDNEWEMLELAHDL